MQWSLDFVPDCVILILKDLCQEMTKRSQENPLPARNSLFSKKQPFLHTHLAEISITPNKQGTFEMREEGLASAGTQDMDTSGYEL